MYFRAEGAHFRARTQELSVGDTFELPLPEGQRTVTVRSVLDDSASDGGMIVVSADLYQEVTASPGSYAYYVRVGDADPDQAQAQIEALFGDQYPRAVVMTQYEMRDLFASITARLVSAFEAFAWVMFGLAVLVGAATLASGLVERQQALALTRLSGATDSDVRRQLVSEALAIAIVAWTVAMPVGLLSISPMLDAVAIQSGLLPSVTLPVLLSLLCLPLVIVGVVLALLVANPRRATTPLRELLAQP